MATIGRAFGFYVKYWQEMEAFYEGKASLGPSSTQDTSEMITKVGDCACEQAAKLLTKCGEEIVKHFSEILGCRAKITSRNSTRKNDWWIDVSLDPLGSGNTPKGCWSTGAIIGESSDDPDPAVILYIYASGRNGQGARQAEEDLAKLLGKERIRGRSAVTGCYVGTVWFGRVPLSERVSDKTFDIDEEELIKKVKGLLGTIRSEDVDELFKI